MRIKQRIYSTQPFSQQEIDKVEKARYELFENTETSSLILSYETNDTLQKIKNIAERIKGEFKTLVIIGAGASINISKMLWSFSKPMKLQVFFVEKTDIKKIQDIFDSNLQRDTCVLSISKSGDTIEVNFLIAKFIHWFNKSLKPSELKTHLYFVTESGSRLDQFAQKIQATSVPHPANIGGRFSFFNTTGLLPAIIFGFKLERLIDAGKEAFKELIQEGSWVMEGALYNYAMSRQFAQSILIKYDSVFDGGLNWVRQLIAESLGKNQKGITPIVSDGMIDRHSQLQLYLDGPDDKFFTLFSYADISAEFDHEKSADSITDLLIPREVASETFRAFNQKQQQALLRTLLKTKKNVRCFIVEAMDEQSVASFVMGNMLEVMLYAYIEDINPFGQSAIEKFKEELNGAERDK